MSEVLLARLIDGEERPTAVFEDLLSKVHTFRSFTSLRAEVDVSYHPLLAAMYLLKKYYNREGISEESWRAAAARAEIETETLRAIMDDYVEAVIPVATLEWLRAGRPKPSLKSVALRYLLTAPDLRRGLVDQEDAYYWG